MPLAMLMNLFERVIGELLLSPRPNGDKFCALTDFGIARLYCDKTQLVQAVKVINLRGLSIVYAFHAKVDTTKENGVGWRCLQFCRGDFVFVGG